jgi:ribosomal protein S18 acetylase RimI-like enzyme
MGGNSVGITIKVPDTEQEFQEMWQLNCDVFCRELGQHPVPEGGLLVDRFHEHNFYRIAWDGEHVCGMICAHSDPPFSAVGHFGEVMAKEVIPGKTAEIRLFSLRPGFRGSRVAAQLAAALSFDLKARGIEKVIITAVASQCRLYKHIGFEVIGGSIIDGNVEFYPMIANVARSTEMLRAIYPF